MINVAIENCTGPIEIVDFPINHGDCPLHYVKLTKGMSFGSLWDATNYSIFLVRQVSQHEEKPLDLGVRGWKSQVHIRQFVGRFCCIKHPNRKFMKVRCSFSKLIKTPFKVYLVKCTQCWWLSFHVFSLNFCAERGVQPQIQIEQTLK